MDRNARSGCAWPMSRRTGQRVRLSANNPGASYLSHGVGHASVDDLGGRRAVGGESGNDLGNVGSVGPGLDTSNGGKNGGSGELHFD